MPNKKPIQAPVVSSRKNSSGIIVVKSKTILVILCFCLLSMSSFIFWSTTFTNFRTDPHDIIASSSFGRNGPPSHNHTKQIGTSVRKEKNQSALNHLPNVSHPTRRAGISGVGNTNNNSCKAATTRTKQDLNYYGNENRKPSNAASIPLDLHQNSDYNSNAFSLNFVPYCDDIEYLSKHQDPDFSEVLFEEYHDQYADTGGAHKIIRLGNGIAKLTPKQLKETAATTLHYVGKELDSLGIPYMLFFGTLLGAYRHHDFIPWDDDADIIILSRHAAELRSILLKRAKDNIVASGQDINNISSNKSSLFQWIVRTGTDSNAIPIKVANPVNGRFVDIISVHPNSRGRLTIVGIPTLGSYPIQYVFPTQPCLFGKHIYPCPNNPERVLNLKYDKIGVLDEQRPLMKGLPEYRGVVATLAEAGVGRIGS